MRIFDTDYYVKEVLLNNDTEQINPITDLKNPLLNSFLGENKSVEPYIENIGNFADDINQQLIFEFLQNADDANNDKDDKQGVFGLFTKKIEGNEYLGIINNGKPFDTNKEGYFHKFIAGIGKANTDEKNKTTGKFGKGSKLLYNLFVDKIDDDDKPSIKRKKAILDNYAGPIVCSWNSAGFIENLLSYEKEDNILLCKDSEYPLFTKIINAYYPVFPGETRIDKNGKEIELFSKNEVKELAVFLQQIDSQFLNTFYNRGSLLFFKLGKGQNSFSSLTEEYKLAIRNSLSFSKNLSHIYYEDTKIQRTELLSTKELYIENHKFEICFPSNDEDIIENNFINFYDKFPVLKEIHGLKFVIESKEFDIKDTRQTIEFNDSSAINRLNDIIELIFGYLNDSDVPFSDRLMLYKAIVASDTSHSSKQEIKDFYNKLIDKVKTIAPVENVFIKNENFIINNFENNIDLFEIGLSQYHKLNDRTKNFYNKITEKFNIPQWDIVETLKKADKDKVRNWIISLDKYEYNKFIISIEGLNISDLEDIPLIISSDNNVYSIAEYKNNNFFLLPRQVPIRELLKNKGAIINEIYLSNLNDIIKQDLEKYIIFFNNQRDLLLPEDKAVIVGFLQDNFECKLEIKNKLEIFKNREGNYCILKNLFNNERISELQHLINFALIDRKEHHPILNEYYFNDTELWKKLWDNWTNDVILSIIDIQKFKEFILKITDESILENFVINKDKDSFKVSKNTNSIIQYYSNDKLFNIFLSDKPDYSLLPEEIKELFSDYNTPDDIIEELIEKYGAQKQFLNVVLDADSNRTKKLYIEKINRLDLDSTQEYNEDTFEYKIIQLSLSIDYESLAKVIYIDNKELVDYKYTDNVYVQSPDDKKIEFKLSKILPEYEGNTDVIERIKNNFVSIYNLEKIFGTEVIENNEVLSKLREREYSSMQMAYIIANNMIDNNMIIAKDCYFSEKHYNDLLTIIYEKGLYKFVQYFSFNIDVKQKILSSEFEFLLDNEKIPDFIFKWIDNDEDKLKFITKNFISKQENIVAFRKYYLEKDIKIINNKLFYDNTFQWLSIRNEFLNKKGKQNIKNAISKYVVENKQLPQYLLIYSSTENSELLKLKEDACSVENVSEKNKKQISELINNSSFDYQIIDNSYPGIDKYFLEENNIFPLKIIPHLDNYKIKSPTEWDIDYYQKWKETKEGAKYKISFLEDSVPLKYRAQIKDNIFELTHTGGGDISSIENNKIIEIYISKPFIEKEQKSILSILTDNNNDIGLHSNDLLILNQIYIDINEERNKIITASKINNKQLESIVKNKKLFNEFTSQIESGKGFGNVQLDKDLNEKEQKLLNELINKFSLENIVNKMKSYNDESDAKINSLTGYIGEMAFQEYLDYTDKNSIKYVAGDGVAEYDFADEINGVFIDIKTTIKTVRGDKDSVPFYIKKSQYKFLINNQPKNYFIARLSLKDIGLQEIRNKYISYNNTKELSNDIKEKIKKEVKVFFNNSVNMELLEETMMLFKLNYDNFFKKIS